MNKFISFTFWLIVLVGAHSQEIPTMTCQFTKFTLVSYDNTITAQNADVIQKLRVFRGKTDEETLRLDGSNRASNSTIWTNITQKDWQTWQSKFLGDFGDVLVISHDLGANKKPLKGLYKASLVSSNANSTSILIGTCLIE